MPTPDFVPLALKAAPVDRDIRIELHRAVWLCTQPIDMRAGTDGALARVVQVFGAARPPSTKASSSSRRRWWPSSHPSMTHLRSMLAFKLCASATAAIDTPGRMHSRITAALNSALCRRRRRRPIRSIPYVFMCPRIRSGHEAPTATTGGQYMFAGRL